jgi:hypothetical protein
LDLEEVDRLSLNSLMRYAQDLLLVEGAERDAEGVRVPLGQGKSVLLSEAEALRYFRRVVRAYLERRK